MWLISIGYILAYILTKYFVSVSSVSWCWIVSTTECMTQADHNKRHNKSWNWMGNSFPVILVAALWYGRRSKTSTRGQGVSPPQQAPVPDPKEKKRDTDPPSHPSFSKAPPGVSPVSGGIPAPHCGMEAQRTGSSSVRTKETSVGHGHTDHLLRQLSTTGQWGETTKGYGNHFSVLRLLVLMTASLWCSWDKDTVFTLGSRLICWIPPLWM